MIAWAWLEFSLGVIAGFVLGWALIFSAFWVEWRMLDAEDREEGP
jgi:hypothetical protein